MNKISIFILLTIVINTGCTSVEQKEALVPGEVKTVVKLERVVVKPPLELMIVPPQVMPINLNKATQRDIAEWLLKSEERTLRLEEQLNAIIQWAKEVKE